MEHKAEKDIFNVSELRSILDSGSVEHILSNHPKLLSPEFLCQNLAYPMDGIEDDEDEDFDENDLNADNIVSVLDYLSRIEKGRAILEIAMQQPEFVQKADSISYSMHGYPIAWHLIESDPGFELLEKHPELLKGNLNVRSSEELMTLLELIAKDTKGIELLQKYPGLLEGEDLNTCPSRGSYRGKTVLWHIANSAKGIELLKEHPELLENGDLNAGSDETVAYLLAKRGQYSLLDNDSFIDLTASTIVPTLLDLLFKDEQFPLIKKIIKQYFLLNKEAELQSLLNSTNTKFTSHLESLIPYLQAENIYQWLSSMMSEENEAQLKEEGEACLSYIEKISGDSYYYKEAQNLKALLYGELSQKGVFLSPPDGNPPLFPQLEPADISFVLVVESFAKANDYSNMRNQLYSYLTQLRCNERKRSRPEEEGEKESKDHTEKELIQPPIKRKKVTTTFFPEPTEKSDQLPDNAGPKKST